MIKYNEVKILVPEGFEKQVMDLVMIKIEGILSQLLLSPTQAKKDEFTAEMITANTQNKIIK